MSTTTVTIIVDAVLFDMDGTLVDSKAGVEGAWDLFAQDYPDIDVQQILGSCHGVRTIDVLKQWCGIEDPQKLEQEARRFELAIVDSANRDGRKGIVAIPGAREILDNLASGRDLPNPSWALCTSATREYATKALSSAGIEPPAVFVTAEDVHNGKPAPDPYLLGARQCGDVDPKKCLVVEDAPSGIRSGKAAGCKTLTVLTSHSREQIEATNPDFIVPDLTSVTMKMVKGGVEVTINLP